MRQGELGKRVGGGGAGEERVGKVDEERERKRDRERVRKIERKRERGRLNLSRWIVMYWQRTFF